MAKIAINLIDMAGNTTNLPLPDDKPVETLLPSVVNLLDLTQTDDTGHALRYCLFSRRFQQIIDPEGTLYSHGILADDELRIVPVPDSTALEFELLTEPSPGIHIPLYVEGRISIGRGSDNDIVIRHAAVSRHHGELVWQDGIHVYRDLNSANGSYINNQLVAEPMPISLGSILSLGETIRLLYRKQPLATPVLEETKVILETEEPLDSRVLTGLTPLPRGSVFIAYETGVLPMVSNLVEELRQANFHIYWDKEIPTGSNAAEALARDLALADVLLVILTPAAVIKSQILEQCNEFILARKPIVPVMYEPSEIPKVLQNVPLVQYKGSFSRLTTDVISTLIRAIH
jgi:pSer/pThr/pTyr-binding forkhead associated (FHA) protein